MSYPRAGSARYRPMAARRSSRSFAIYLSPLHESDVVQLRTVVAVEEEEEEEEVVGKQLRNGIVSEYTSGVDCRFLRLFLLVLQSLLCAGSCSRSKNKTWTYQQLRVRTERGVPLDMAAVMMCC